MSQQWPSQKPSTTKPFDSIKDLVARYHHERGPMAEYRRRPEDYARDVLGITWWSKQAEVAEALLDNRKVFVKASHAIGKTFLAGSLVNWFFDSYRPSIVKTTAPTKNQVVDLTWREVRIQRNGRDMQPMAPRMWGKKPDGTIDHQHYAAGYTARDSDAFQGTHERHLFILFEEAVGIDRPFWVAADGMLSSGKDNIWLAIMNPTDPTSTAYQYEMAGGWKVVTISAMEHPNIAAALRGKMPPYSKAVSIDWVREQLASNCEPVAKTDKEVGDVPWPPLDFCEERETEPSWYRPNAEFEGRVLGRWPSQPMDSIWSEALWNAAVQDGQAENQKWMLESPPEIGCDRARMGDDRTAIHIRRGPVSLHHESHKGWETMRTLHRLIELAGIYGRKAGIDAHQVLVKVDDFGGGIVDPALSEKYNFVEVNSASKAFEPERYKNRRSELWFTTRDRAKEGRLDLSGLPESELDELRRQLMAPRWAPNASMQRVVEEKAITKKRVKRSPDDADAMNLAYAAPPPSMEFWIS